MSSRNLSLGALILAIFAGVCAGQTAETFRGTVPLLTTRGEVEKKLGKPDTLGRFELDEGRVYIDYRESKCQEKQVSCFCLASLGTVLSIRVRPNENILIGNLGLDPMIWHKSPVRGHVDGMEVYVNEDLGVAYNVEAEDGIVTSISYGVSKATCDSLRARHSKTASVPRPAPLAYVSQSLPLRRR